MPAAGAPAAPDPMAGGMGADPMAAGGAMPGADPMAAGGAMAGADPMAGVNPIDGMPTTPGVDPMGGGMPGVDQMNGFPPTNGAGFDMGIGMTPDEDPKKYIEGAVAKVATELRKYQQGLPKPDMELNKTAVNTIAAATKTGIQPNQVDELMSSYADAMRRESGEGSDGNDGGTNMGADSNAGADPMGGGADAGANTDQAPLEERLKIAVKEFFRRKQEKNKQRPKGEIERIDQRDSFTRKPFTPPIEK